MRIIMEKCKWICLGHNNPQTRYSLGREMWKHIKNESLLSKGCFWQLQRPKWSGRQGGNRLGRRVVLTGSLLIAQRDLITGLAPSFSPLNVFLACSDVPGAGGGKCLPRWYYDMRVSRVIRQHSNYQASALEWTFQTVFFFFFYFYFYDFFNKIDLPYQRLSRLFLRKKWESAKEFLLKNKHDLFMSPRVTYLG